MENDTIKKVLIILILLVGNSVFMLQAGTMELSEHTYNAIGNLFFYRAPCFLINRVLEGFHIIASYAFILFITIKIFSKKKDQK